MASGEQEIQLVIFRLGVEEYGVPITQVQEINLLSKPTKIPNSPVFLEGVINLRGRIIPVVDLKKRFALDHTKYTKDAQIMIVEVNESVIGVIVDEVLEVLRLPAGSIEPPPPVIAGITAAYLDGVGKLDDRLFILLNMDKVLTVSEQEELEQVESMADSGEILIQEG
jgi:purine-binding chemotaxis protein CheW